MVRARTPSLLGASWKANSVATALRNHPFLLNLLTDNAVPHDLVEALIGLCMASHCLRMLLLHVLHIFRRSVRSCLTLATKYRSVSSACDE